MPRAADAADSLGLHGRSYVLPGGRNARCDFEASGLEEDWRLVSQGDSNCLETKIQDHQEGDLKECKKPWRKEWQQESKELPRAFEGCADFFFSQSTF